MSIARQHAEWLSLVEVSGPFLSMPVLLRALPQGLDAHDVDLARALRLAYDEWLDNQGGLRPDPAVHRAWVRFVLTQALGFPTEVLLEGQAIPAGLTYAALEHGETLRPDLVVMRSGRGEPARLLVAILPYAQQLDKPLMGTRWKASPQDRMATLLRETGTSLGLVSNGEHWMLVHAPRGETAGFASWYAHLWFEEAVTLRSFRTLLGMHRFYGAADEETPEALLRNSASDQQEVTDQLGYQVRRAVEVLVSAIDRIDRDRGRALLTGVAEATLYEAALTVMMRLVFMFSAEERGLLQLGHALYDQNYAISTLRAQLRAAADQAGEEVLERRNDAWSRILATLRAIYGGVRHEDLHLRAYGGHLFDPDRFPLLEGRLPQTSWRDTTAAPLAINNRVVLHLLEALQILRVQVPGGGPAEPRRLSFRSLDVEQIGHVYEGLLDHTARRATEPILGLAGTKDREPEIPLARLEALRAQGTDSLVAVLAEQTGRSKSALVKALGQPLELAAGAALRVACDNDDALLARVLPFAGLIRKDSFGHPVVIPAGSVYVTAGTDHRSSGTHYTPRSLTEPIVQHTLDPLVYVGPAEGKPKEEWRLRSPAAILRLTVCDLAMGSGAFLVQACRYLSERLVEAWERAESAAPNHVVVTPEGELATIIPADCLIPRDGEERLAVALRLVADRCLYGVDKNPLAVEMAKLSLWLITLQKDRPFTFLDHALRAGDSLLGVTDLDQILLWSLRPDPGVKKAVFITEPIRRAVHRAIGLRRRIRQTPDVDIRTAERKMAWLRQAEEALDLVRLAGDLLVAAEFHPNPKVRPALRDDFLVRLTVVFQAFEQLHAGRFTERDAGEAREELAKLRAEADALLEGRKPFHWPLEFPEVFIAEARDDAPDVQRLLNGFAAIKEPLFASLADEPPGMAAIVGNPPFLGGTRISTSQGKNYLSFLQAAYPSFHSRADLCSLFYLRAFETLRMSGKSGLIATNTIAEGDTREAGLDWILAHGSLIYRATTLVSWPGTAAVSVNIVHLHKGQWEVQHNLNGMLVSNISAFLDAG